MDLSKSLVPLDFPSASPHRSGIVLGTQTKRKTTNANSRSTTVVLDSGKTGTRPGVEMLDSTQEEYNPTVGSGMYSVGRNVHLRPNLYSHLHRPG